MARLYGDGEWEGESSALAHAALAQIARGSELESLRALLIACGQLEQGLCDSGDAGEWRQRSACSATDCAAAAFYANWCRFNHSAFPATWDPERELDEARTHLAGLAQTSVRTRIKIPEGFAFYALFPEQYCAAAVRFLREHERPPGRVHVIGLRTIGTALSAAVAAVLRAAEHQHRRYTARPEGHPFGRTLQLDAAFASADAAWVIDEGPGLSGSSLFAAHRALAEVGVDDRRQVFFCGHDAGPGEMASPEVLSFWSRARRSAAGSERPALSRHGPLPQTLMAELRGAYGAPVRELIDCSAGLWRAQAFADARQWPAAYPAFERPKLLARFTNGTSALLKFYGQVLIARAGDTQSADSAAAEQVSNTARPALCAHGYVVRPWLEGRLLCRADKNAQVLEAVAAFLGSRAWRWTGSSSRAADACSGCSGRLAPQEWLSDASGELVKLPETLQGYDHSAIDEQPLGWDLAGAIVEWQLDSAETRRLLRSFGAHSGLNVSTAEVAPHVQRYAEFQKVKAEFCSHGTAPAELQRLQAEIRHYSAYANWKADD